MVSIYQDEGSADKLVRKKIIEAALYTETKLAPSITKKHLTKESNIHANSVRAIANLLRKIESYDNDKANDFKDNNTAVHAQQMAQGFEKELGEFLKDTKGMKKDSPPYNERLKTFNDNCHTIIKDNLAGVSHEPTFMNAIKSAVNSFLKFIGAEPIKLETTSFARNADIKAGLKELKSSAIAQDEIEEVERKSDFKT